MDIERKDNVFKVSIPAITDDEIRAIDNNFDEIAHKFSEMIIHDKDLIIAQRVIQNLRAELEKKDKIINLMAERLEHDTEWFYSEFDDYKKQDFIEYFTNKVEEDK